jgi:hypothetical protein
VKQYLIDQVSRVEQLFCDRRKSNQTLLSIDIEQTFCYFFFFLGFLQIGLNSTLNRMTGSTPCYGYTPCNGHTPCNSSTPGNGSTPGNSSTPCNNQNTISGTDERRFAIFSLESTQTTDTLTLYHTAAKTISHNLDCLAKLAASFQQNHLSKKII